MPSAEDGLVSTKKQAGPCQWCRIGPEEGRTRRLTAGVCERERGEKAKKAQLKQIRITETGRDATTMERQKTTKHGTYSDFSVLIVQICILKQVHPAQKTCNL